MCLERRGLKVEHDEREYEQDRATARSLLCIGPRHEEVTYQTITGTDFGGVAVGPAISFGG